MNWIELTDENQLISIKEKSNQTPQLIFKHSTRCTISIVAKNRLEKTTLPNNIDFYYLDLIKHRAISAKIANEFNVSHESPQVLLIHNEKCIYDESHYGIEIEEIERELHKN